MYEVSCKITISKDGVFFLTPANTLLLSEIEDTGSLVAAAKSIGISYMKAWNMTTALNRSSKEPIVLLQRGGHQGGGAELSAYGKRLLMDYGVIENQVTHLMSQINMELNL
jgi:molybdate transport system regulatory protein